MITDRDPRRRSTTPSERRADLRGAGRRAGRDARRRLARAAGSRASASRPATSSASCAASTGSGSTTRRASCRWCRRCGDWLAANMPESPEATIVHGDYRLGNTMFGRRAPARLVAIFDWELATIGDPLADVGYLTATWSQPDDPQDTMFASLTAVTHARGLPRAATSWSRATRSAAAARCRSCTGTRRSRSGRRPSSWRATTSAASPATPTTRT